MRSAAASARSDDRSASYANNEVVAFRKTTFPDVGWTSVLQVGSKVSDRNDCNAFAYAAVLLVVGELYIESRSQLPTILDHATPAARRSP